MTESELSDKFNALLIRVRAYTPPDPDADFVIKRLCEICEGLLRMNETKNAGMDSHDGPLH